MDWPVLREQLLAEVQDLVPGARLHPVDDLATAGEGLELATVPAVLQPASPAAGAPRGMTPVRWALLLGWLAAGMAVCAAGHTVRASLALGERRSRFAKLAKEEIDRFKVYRLTLDNVDEQALTLAKNGFNPEDDNMLRKEKKDDDVDETSDANRANRASTISC